MSTRIQAIVMPKLGLSMTEGLVSKWYVTPQTRVKAGDIIADIETSKITNELEAFTSGIVAGELAETDVDLPVGTLLGLIVQDGVTAEEIDEFVASFQQSPDVEVEATQLNLATGIPSSALRSSNSDSVEKQSNTGPSIPESIQGYQEDQLFSATHLARKMAQKWNINLAMVKGTGRKNRISKKDLRQAIIDGGGHFGDKTGPTPDEHETDDGNIAATPLARKMARNQGISLALIRPTGSKDRVTKNDVEAYLRHLGKSDRKGLMGATPDQAFKEIRINSMRRLIGRRMTESKQQAPHFRLGIEVNIDPLLKLKSFINGEHSSAKISINDILIKATALALTEVPDLNCQFDGQVLKRFTHADIAVAVAVEGGLITPVVRAANQKDLLDISSTMADLANRAKEGTLEPEEFTGGTFTISNLGMFGITSFDGIINPPQVAILAVGAATRRLTEGNGSQVFASLMNLTLSCDHRVIDGALGAKFLVSLKKHLENPYQMI